MKSLLRTWFAAPLFLSGLWTLTFVLTVESPPDRPWWYDFVLHPDGSVLAALTTGLFHVDSVHLVSNVVLIFFIVYSFRSCLNFVDVLLLWWCIAPCAALVSYTIDPAPLIGASGGVLGIFGGALFRGVSLTNRRTFNWSIWALACVFVVSIPGDRVAHIVGLVFGYGGFFLQRKVLLKRS
ncbi:MAG: rhomboid family intramembrane serine protease [Bradymonadia bacterium]